MTVVLFISKALGLNLLQAVVGRIPHGERLQVVHFDDTNDKRSVLSEIEQFCGSNAISFFVARHPKEYLSQIDRASWIQEGAVAIVSGWYTLFSDYDIETFPGGVWGIHHSPLPSYRGGSPLVWQILNNEQFVGTSVFRIGTGVDRGPVLAQYLVRNEHHDHIGTLLDKLHEELFIHADDWLKPILEGSAVGKPQEDTTSTPVYPLRNSADNVAIIQNSSAQEVYLLAKALNHPYPGLKLESQCGCEFREVQLSDLNPEGLSHSFVCSDGKEVRIRSSCRVISCEQHELSQGV